MTHATRIDAAQKTVLAAQALRDVLADECNAAVPAPDPTCDDATFSAWNDRYEDELEASGCNRAADMLAAARDELYAAGSAWVREVTRNSGVLELLAMVERGHYVARTRLLDLWMRLDTRTVDA